ncbi:hypothetical protein ACC853_37400, partial [Rhizobium johnstonii]
MKSKSQSLLLRPIALHAALAPLALIWLFPLWMIFVFSTMPDNGIFSPDIVLWPSKSAAPRALYRSEPRRWRS